MLKFGSSLVKLRKSKNFTQQQVADILYVSRSSYASWESDIHELPLSKLFSLPKVYSTSLADILDLIFIENKEVLEKENFLFKLSAQNNAQSVDIAFLNEELANIKQLIKDTLLKE